MLPSSTSVFEASLLFVEIHLLQRSNLRVLLKMEGNIDVAYKDDIQETDVCKHSTLQFVVLSMKRGSSLNIWTRLIHICNLNWTTADSCGPFAHELLDKLPHPCIACVRNSPKAASADVGCP